MRVMSRSGRRRILVSLGIIVAVVTVWASRRSLAERSDHQAAPAAVPVSVAAASRRDVPVRLSALGSVAAFNTVTVKSRVDGQLMDVLFHEGQMVKQGDVLAQIDPRPFQVQLEQANGQLAKDEAQLTNARVDLDRYQTLWSEDSIAKQNLDAQQSTVKQLEAALEADRAAVAGAQLNLTYARITAPISGRVGLRMLDAGNVISAASSAGLVVITQVDPIAVLFTLPEDALRAILPRLRAHATLPIDAFDRSGVTHLASGTVVTTDNEIDPTTGTIRVKAVFDNRNRALFPSQFVNVRVLADTRPSQLVIPSESVQQGPQGPFVYVVQNSTATVRPIRIDSAEEDVTTVAGGLSDGEVVVTDGAERLRDGTRVEVRR
jgi:multidrug efflux system membrane fusion protein